MNEYEIRKPIQKRSIEKKEKIIQSQKTVTNGLIKY